MLLANRLRAGGIFGEEGWDITNATFNVSEAVSQDSQPRNIFFNPDGSQMFMVGLNTDRLYAYTLSTPWDLSTMVYSQNVSLSGIDSLPRAVYFKSDGTSYYGVGNSSNTVKRVDLSTAWDISTASATSDTFSVGGQETGTRGLWFKPDGTKMYVVGLVTDAIYEYSLPTPWSVSTAIYTTGDSFTVSSQSPNPTALFFKPDGTKMYVAEFFGTLYQYELSTPWDINSVGYSGVNADLSAQGAALEGISFQTDGSKLFALNGTAVDEYLL